MQIGSEALRNAIWDSMLNAELSVFYWGTKSRKWEKKQRFFGLVLAYTTSGVVGGWFISWLASLAGSSHPVVKTIGLAWKIISFFMAGIAHGLYLLDWKKTIRDMSRLNGKWHQIQSQYEMMWFDFEIGQNLDDIVREYKHTRYMEPLAEEDSPDLPGRDTKLWEESWWNVIKSRGLETEERSQ